MEGGGDAGELDLAQGPGHGRQGPGGIDHRSHDLAGRAAEGARGVRGRVEEDAVFLPAAARGATANRPQQGGNGEVPPRDAEALPRQDTAL